MKLLTFIKKNRFHLFCLVLCFVIAGTFVAIARYALPKTDDFSNLSKGVYYFSLTQDASAASWGAMKDGYFDQQGTFFSGFTSAFLLLRIGTNLILYKQFVIAFVCFFFLAYIFSMSMIAKHFDFHAIWGLFALCTLWTALDFVGPGESLMFVTGITVYGLPIALSLLAIAFYTLLMDANKGWQMVLCTLISAGCAFFSCGGVLMVAAMTNLLMVLIFIRKWVVTRQFPWRGLLPFLFAFASALTNALAPGNFKRYARGVGDASATPDIGTSLVNTFHITNEHFGNIFSQTYVLIALVLIAISVFCCKQTLDKQKYSIHPLFFFLGGYALAYISMFPSVLGYAMVPHGFIQERTLFAFTQAAVLGLLIAWTYLCFWWKTHPIVQLERRTLATVICVLLLVVSVVANTCYVSAARSEKAKTTLAQFYTEYSTGYIQKCYAAYYLATLNTINEREDRPFYVNYEIPDSKLLPEHCLSSDPQWWINVTMAQAYKVVFFAYTPDHPFTEADAMEHDTTIADLQP
ncbi:MAG: DUF6056 family protein [Lachnospiraceae bacterium]|nr:DUF6056 family protein [Lachnospiraceae bacterium]